LESRTVGYFLIIQGDSLDGLQERSHLSTLNLGGNEKE
jgi:hypothetical protein